MLSNKTDSRKKRLGGSAALALVLALSLATAGCQDSSAESVKPLKLVDGPGLPLTDTKHSRFSTAMLGEQGFVAQLNSKNDLSIAALDLAENKPTWPARTLGKYGDLAGLAVHDDALMVMGERDGVEGEEGGADRTLFMLDPATGEKRWQTEFDVNDGDLEFFQSTIVVRASNEPVTKGLDWKTGAVKWSIPNPAGAVVETIGIGNTGEEANPNRVFVSPYTDNRLLMLSEDKSMRTYDANTGALLETRQNVAGSIQSFAQDGTLYSLDDQTPVTLKAYDLAKPGEPRTIYTASGDKQPSFFVGCGAQRVCFIEDGAQSADLVAVDTAAGQQLWRTKLDSESSMANLTSTGEHIVVGDTAYTFDGKVAVKPERKSGKNTALNPIDNSTFLTFTIHAGENKGSQDSMSAPTATEISTFSTSSEKRKSLGTIPMIVEGQPSWNKNYVLLITENKAATARI